MTRPAPVEVSIRDATERSIEISIIVGDRKFDVRFRASVALFTERADALVPLALVAAMRTGRPLQIRGAVSHELMRNARPAQEILSSFTDGTLSRIDIAAAPAPRVTAIGSGVGCFFSCGVDSFYSALTHANEITHLIFVQGFDVLTEATPRAHAALEAARRAAAELDIELIEVETNLRTMTESFAQWHFAHGPALGLVALLLQGHLRRVYVPGGQAYQDLFPIGSHPLLDRLWGTEGLEIVHDGCDVVRTKKVYRIAQSDTALRFLRVCTKQYATFNCGKCEKCLRTMVNLRLAGALERCPTLPHSIDLGAIAKLRIDGGCATANWGDNLRTARAANDLPIVLAASVAHRPRPLHTLRRRLGMLRRAVTTAPREDWW